MQPLGKLLLEAKVTSIALSELGTDEETFQFRNVMADGCKAHFEKTRSSKHVGVLAGVVSAGGLLEPMLTIKDNSGRYIVIDGHHRLKAYRRVLKNKGDTKVPVNILPSYTTKDEARLLALSSNKNDKLSMTKRQKTESIWMLIRTSGLVREISARSIEALIGKTVTHPTIGKMLKYFKKLDTAGEPTDILWHTVSRGRWEDDANADSDKRRQDRMDKLEVGLAEVFTKVGGMPVDDILTAIQGALAFQGLDLFGTIYQARDEDEDDDCIIAVSGDIY